MDRCPMHEWLLIACLVSNHGNCDPKGSLSIQKVTEVQCLAAIRSESQIWVSCISPTGEVRNKITEDRRLGLRKN